MAPRETRPSVEFLDTSRADKSPLYSLASVSSAAGRLIFTAGHVGTKDGKLVPQLNEQVKQCFTNLKATLAASGARIEDIVHLRLYVVDWRWPETQQLIESWMDIAKHRPTSTFVPVTKLHEPDVFLEVEAVAAIGGRRQPYVHDLRNPASVQNDLVSTATPIKVDAVVVGAGFSGMQAAYDLHNAGLSVIVLEATPRIGGRSKTIKLASGPGYTELGATWINKNTQPKIYGLVQKFGLHCVPQFSPHDHYAIFQTSDGIIRRASQSEKSNSSQALPAADLEAVTKLLQAMDADSLANPKVDLNNTTSFPESEDMSVADWVMSKGLGSFALSAVSAICSALCGREPDEVSIHYLMDYVKSGGGYTALSSEDENGSQSMWIREGTSAIAHGLAAALKPGTVLTNSPVDTLTQTSTHVVVQTSSGDAYHARKVVVAIPTNTYGRIQFVPPLPFEKRQIASRTLPGVYAKVLLTYRRPWWRELGMLGKFRSQIGPVSFSWELSNFETNAYTLAIFVSGKRAVKWYALSPLARQTSIIDHLAELVGPEHAHLAQDVLEYNAGQWVEEEFMGGAPTSAVPPGLPCKYGEHLRAPFDNIHFAGGETAREWKGYLEGALRAGTRAADEVIGLLGEGKRDTKL